MVYVFEGLILLGEGFGVLIFCIAILKVSLSIDQWLGKKSNGVLGVPLDYL